MFESNQRPAMGSRLPETKIVGADGQVKAVLRFLNPADQKPEVIEAFVQLMVEQGYVDPSEPFTVK